MDRWKQMADILLRLIDQYDEWAITLFVLTEEAGLPLPVPGDVAMLMAGYRVARGEMNLLWILFLLMLATLVGSSILYWLGARGGRPLLYRYGRYLHMDKAKLERAEAWLAQRGLQAVLLGRIIPGLRIITPLMAGALGVPYRTFVPALMISSFVYILTLVLLGMWVGPRAIEIVEGLHLPLRAVLTGVSFLVIGGVLVLLYRRAARHRRLAVRPSTPLLREMAPPETAVLAGFLATVEMILGVNLLLYVLTAAGVIRAEAALLIFVDRAADHIAGGSVPGLIGLLAVVMLGINLLMSLLYAGIGIRYLPGEPWLEGLLFGLFPFLLWVLVLLPVFGAGPLGLGLDAGLWPLAGEALRNALFGLGLGMSHALLYYARSQPAVPAPALSEA